MYVYWCSVFQFFDKLTLSSKHFIFFSWLWLSAHVVIWQMDVQVLNHVIIVITTKNVLFLFKTSIFSCQNISCYQWLTQKSLSFTIRGWRPGELAPKNVIWTIWMVIQCQFQWNICCGNNNLHVIDIDLSYITMWQDMAELWQSCVSMYIRDL